MAVLKLKPYLKHYLWGGRKLIDRYGIESDQMVAEAWVVSCHPEGPSQIDQGNYQGMTLIDYIQLKGSKILGTRGQDYTNFPILIKLLDANMDLSIQVHPDDDYALKVENEYGKNELWLILESENDSYIYYGVKEKLSTAQFQTIIQESKILDHLKQVFTQPYDYFYIPAGTIHALGKGNVIAEVQQSSNSTYRIYDFNRKDAKGNLRDLHLDKALDVSNLEPNVDLDKKAISNHTVLSDTQYFRTVLRKIDGSVSLQSSNDSFQALLIIKGTGRLNDATSQYTLQPGDGLFVEANTHYSVEGTLELLITEV